MAKETLPTNFIDDIMTDEMGNKRRYNLIQNSDGTVSLEDVTTYTQTGSTFGASQINATNTAVNESADKNKIIDSLDDVAANTQSGMIAGALAVAELNRKSTMTETGDSVNLEIYNASNPYVTPSDGYARANSWDGGTSTVYISGMPIASTNSAGSHATFVRKGTKLYASCQDGSNATFYPLK